MKTVAQPVEVRRAEPDLIDLVADALPAEIRADFYREMRHCRSLPENDEMLRILRAMQFLVLLIEGAPGRVAVERQLIEKLVTEIKDHLRETLGASEEYHAQLESRLIGLPDAIAKGISPEAIAATIRENLRQHFVRSTLPETVDALGMTANQMKEVCGKFAATARDLGETYHGAAQDARRAVSSIRAEITAATNAAEHAAKELAWTFDKAYRWSTFSLSGLGVILGFVLGGFFGYWIAPSVEADWRMLLPFAGLMLAVAGVLSIATARVLKSARLAEGSRYRMPAAITAAVLAAGVLGLAEWGTFERNAVWESEDTLWTNATTESPRSARAWMHFALTRPAVFDRNEPLNYMQRAAALAPHDPVIEINLARTYGRLGRNAEAENQFRRATADGATFSPSWSAYGQWLLDESRPAEASEMAMKALALDPYDLAARRTVMDVMAQDHQWVKLQQFANDTLHLLPYNPDAQRSLLVAQTGREQIRQAETQAQTQPTVDHYLALSVLYFQTERYQDCVDSAREALKINPNLGEAWANIASAYHAMGKVDDTIAALREEIRLNPNLPSAKANLEFELAAKEKSGH